jgi:hypothetical protein
MGGDSGGRLVGAKPPAVEGEGEKLVIDMKGNFHVEKIEEKSGAKAAR